MQNCISIINFVLNISTYENNYKKLLMNFLSEGIMFSNHLQILNLKLNLYMKKKESLEVDWTN